MPELLAGLSKWEKNLPDDPTQRPFARLERGPDGKYNDDDLVKIMQAAIEDVSGKLDCLPHFHFAPDFSRLFRRSQCSQVPSIH